MSTKELREIYDSIYCHNKINYDDLRYVLYTRIKKNQDIINLLDILYTEDLLIILFDFNKNLLHLAVECGNIELIKYLLKIGFDPNEQLIDGDTCLHILFGEDINNKYAIFKLLLEYGADPNIKNNIGQYPIHYAGSNNNIQDLMMIIYEKIDIQVLDNDRNSVIYYILGKHNSYGMDCCKLLIRNGYKMNYKDLINLQYLHSINNHNKIIYYNNYIYTLDSEDIQEYYINLLGTDNKTYIKELENFFKSYHTIINNLSNKFFDDITKEIITFLFPLINFQKILNDHY